MAREENAEITTESLRQLVDGQLPYAEVKKIVHASNKDRDRTRKYLEVLQQRVSWDDPILLRISEHLYVVRKDGDKRIVKCDCSHEFDDYRINWKLRCRIRVRTTDEEFAEVYATKCRPDPALVEVREFYCPGCVAQLAVEVVPKGYPIQFEFLPDLDALYRDWLDSPLADEHADWFQDLSSTLNAKWAK